MFLTRQLRSESTPKSALRYKIFVHSKPRIHRRVATKAMLPLYDLAGEHYILFNKS